MLSPENLHHGTECTWRLKVGADSPFEPKYRYYSAIVQRVTEKMVEISYLSHGGTIQTRLVRPEDLFEREGTQPPIFVERLTALSGLFLRFCQSQQISQSQLETELMSLLYTLGVDTATLKQHYRDVSQKNQLSDENE